MYGTISGKVGDTRVLLDRLYSDGFYLDESICSVDALAQGIGKEYNNCYVCLALDNFIVTSSNPQVLLKCL